MIHSLFREQKHQHNWGFVSCFHHLYVDTPWRHAHQNLLRLVVGGRGTERHYLMIIEIILYTRASLKTAHQSDDYSALACHNTSRYEDT